MSDAADRDHAPPDICPRGHAIWWFEHGDEVYREHLHWGICSGGQAKTPMRPAAGRCREVWLWDARRGDEPLKTIYEFNVQCLTGHLRRLAFQVGLFTDG